MATNDVVLLDSLIKRIKPRYGSTLNDSDVFELFAFDQLLKQLDPSYEELTEGWVGGGNDGGIDGFFVYVDGRAVTTSVEKTASLQCPDINLVIVTARSSAKFQQQPIDSIHNSLSELLDLTKSDSELSYPYNEDVLRQRARFRSAYVDLVERKPSLTITVHYCSRGDTSQVAPNIRARASAVHKLMERLFGDAAVSFKFQGASELLECARRRPDRSLRLPYIESYISREGKNFVVLVKLTDYFDFVTDDSGELRRYLFDTNVRDYLGQGLVNRDISATLRQSHPSAPMEDFWWLNNGVTVLCTNVAVAGKTLSIENVQIINGLQTTETLFEVFRSLSQPNDDRAILVKIIAAADDDIRARIVKATNYQSTVDLSSLRGLDKIQRDIEQYLEDHGWFYDRRRNYFKNQGKPADRIVAVTYLASAVRAVALGDPAKSPRQRAKSLRDDAVYSKVFDPDWNLEVFLASLEIVRAVELALQSGKERRKKQHLSSPPIRSVHFVAYAVVCLRLGKISYDPEEILQVGRSLPTVAEVQNVRDQIKEFCVGEGAPGLSFSAELVDRFLQKALDINDTN